MSSAGQPTPREFRATSSDVDLLDDFLDEGPPSGIRPLVPLFAIPWLVIRLDGLRFLPLDARAGYLVSLIDGRCSVETILDICALEVHREDALEILATLLQLGVIELRDP